DIWQAIPPAGKFTAPAPEQSRHSVYFAAGGGIVPIYAHLKYLLAHAGNTPITLIYSNQTEDNIIFKQQLENLAAQHSSRFAIRYFISSKNNRLNNLWVEQLVKELIPAVDLHNG